MCMHCLSHQSHMQITFYNHLCWLSQGRASVMLRSHLPRVAVHYLAPVFGEVEEVHQLLAVVEGAVAALGPNARDLLLRAPLLLVGVDDGLRR